MPEIALLGTPDDRGWVRSVMFFPNDEPLREFVFARMSAEAQVQELDAATLVTLRAGTIRSLLHAPSFKEFDPIKRQAAQAGFIAGDLLVMVYLMAQVAKTPKPSVNKAIYAYSNLSKLGGRWGDGRPLPRSESAIREAWSSHKSVSHLWGALRINEGYPFADREDVFGVGWDNFLGVAAGLLEFGCNFVPQNLKRPAPTLDKDHCWSLPATILPQRLVTSRMPHGLLDLLKGYKAPQPM